MSDYGVVLFATSSSAMRAEAILVRSALAAKLIPTPRQLSSDCGVALRIEWNQNDRVSELLTKAGVEVAGMHRLPGGKA
jgi:hypothetical protein